mgnify:CR=1 FL=1
MCACVLLYVQSRVPLRVYSLFDRIRVCLFIRVLVCVCVCLFICESYMLMCLCVFGCLCACVRLCMYRACVWLVGVLFVGCVSV